VAVGVQTAPGNIVNQKQCCDQPQRTYTCGARRSDLPQDGAAAECKPNARHHPERSFVVPEQEELGAASENAGEQGTNQQATDRR